MQLRWDVSKCSGLQEEEDLNYITFAFVIVFVIVIVFVSVFVFVLNFSPRVL